MPELNAVDKDLGGAVPRDVLAVPVKRGGYQVKVDKEKCKGCRLCIFYCPVQHLVLSSQLNSRGRSFAQARPETACKGCGFCFLMCPDSCIEVHEK